MIRFVYSKERLWTVYEAIWCFLIFFVNNIIFFYIVLKASFQDFVPRPPIAISIIFLILLLADCAYTPYRTKEILHPRWIVDFIIWICVLLAMVLPN